MSGLDLRTIAVALGGEVQGQRVRAPGPGHSRLDRSLSVRLSSTAPGGFTIHSFAEDPFDLCRDYVASRLGLALDHWHTHAGAPRPAPIFTVPADGLEPGRERRIARSVAIWNEAGPALGSIVETYLASRGLSLDLVYNVHEVLRFHPRCPWRDEAENRTIYVPAMVALMRSVTTDEPQAIHRTRLSAQGVKVDRRMLGIAAGAAVKIDADDAVTMGLAIGEGIETVLAARQLGFRPAWALASAGGIKGFPILGGIECLTLLAENDPTNAKAVNECGTRWHRAGCEVTIVEPLTGSDINDALRSVA